MSNHHQNHAQNGLKQPQVTVVMVPFPAQGHLNQLLHLSCLVSSYHIPVHYVGSATHLRQARLRIHGWDPVSISNCHFHEFPIPFFHSPPPNPNSPTKFPSHLQPCFDSVSNHLRHPVTALVHTLSLSSRRVVILHDSVMASVVQDTVSIPNAESYTFHSVSAFSVFLFLWEAFERPSAVESEMLKDLPALDGCFTPKFVEFMGKNIDCLKFNSGDLYNTSRVIENPFLELLEKEQIGGKKKHWAIGPFNPVEIRGSGSSNTIDCRRHKCLEWLDEQEKDSVVYVSFGTTTCFSDEQIREIAIGLERSEMKFVWVVRDADKGDVFVGGERKAELPEGFGERIKGRGMVVRDWAPQLEILEHPSTGGFVSHCGWNSCIESITMGVPIVAWPMHSDQPRNSVLVTKFLKVGMVLRDWGRRDELVTAAMVEEVVKRLMDSEEGDEIRKTAAQLGLAVRQSVVEGGVSRLELDSFVAHICRQ